MSWRRWPRLLVRCRVVRVGLALLAAMAVAGCQSTDVLTYHNDNARTGQYLGEKILKLANVNSAQFGKRFVLNVDGKVDAQPLYKSGVVLPGRGIHNVLYVATEHDSVFAFDADTGGAPLWHVSILARGETPSDDRGCSQVTPEIGITATPVIDPFSGPHGTVYVVAMSKNAVGGYFQRLHALDLTTGAEQFHGPVVIQADFPGSGDNSFGGKVIFDPAQYKEWPGLLLLGGTIYTMWSSHCDIRPYTGWIIAYKEKTLARSAVLNITPNGSEAAIWAAGAGPAADPQGNIYFLSVAPSRPNSPRAGFRVGAISATHSSSCRRQERCALRTISRCTIRSRSRMPMKTSARAALWCCRT